MEDNINIGKGDAVSVFLRQRYIKGRTIKIRGR